MNGLEINAINKLPNDNHKADLFIFTIPPQEKTKRRPFDSGHRP
jgi:hypothetical protein